MGRYLIKPKADEDFYLMWSTVVDAPVQWGPRASFVRRAINNDWISDFESRFARVDEYGDDSGFGSQWFEEGPERTITYAGSCEPVIGIWETRVEDLRALVETYDGDGRPTEATKQYLRKPDWDDEGVEDD